MHQVLRAHLNVRICPIDFTMGESEIVLFLQSWHLIPALNALAEPRAYIATARPDYHPVSWARMRP